MTCHLKRYGVISRSISFLGFAVAPLTVGGMELGRAARYWAVATCGSAAQRLSLRVVA